MKLPVFALVVILPVSLLTAQNNNSWLKNGKPAADTAAMKSKNGFGAELLLTENAQFFADWNKPETPKITSIKKARRDVPVYTAILFVDPGTDSSGAADVTCDISLRKPDGSVYGEQKGLKAWKGKYAVPAHNLQLAQGRMGIRVEPQDPPGTYALEVVVHDNIKKVDLSLKATFEVAK